MKSLQEPARETAIAGEYDVVVCGGWPALLRLNIIGGLAPLRGYRAPLAPLARLLVLSDRTT